MLLLASDLILNGKKVKSDAKASALNKVNLIDTRCHAMKKFKIESLSFQRYGKRTTLGLLIDKAK